MELNTSNNAGDPGEGDGIEGNRALDEITQKSGEQTAKVGRGIYIPPPPDSRPCVVCKKVHLSCDRMRPCGRCIRLQREAECCDPPNSRRGRKSRDVPEPLEENSTAVRVKVEKRQRGNNISSPEPSFDSIPRPPHDRNEDPLLVAIREGTLRMFWNHYYIVGCTQEYGAMLGYKQEELLGMPWAMLHPPELSEFYIRGMDMYLSKMPDYVTEVDNGADLVMQARNGRRFQIFCEYKMFLRNREPLMGWTIIRAIVRDNLPPGYMPPQGYSAFVELWNRVPAVRQPDFDSSPSPPPLTPSQPQAQPLGAPVTSIATSLQPLRQQPQHLFQPIPSSEIPSSPTTTLLSSTMPQNTIQQVQPSGSTQQQQQQMQNLLLRGFGGGGASTPIGTAPINFTALSPAQQHLLMQQQSALAQQQQQNNVIFTTSNGLATGSHVTGIPHPLPTTSPSQPQSQSPFLW